MKKIKFMMIAMMAAIASMSFVACSDDDDDNTAGNYDRMQEVVNNTVMSQKKSDKVILLVAFGSTWQQAFETFDKIKSEYEANFSGWDVYISFSSAICINNAKAGEHADEGAEVRYYYSPENWLAAIGVAGYKQIVVQSLQVIPGEEYRRVRDSYVKDFMNNHKGYFTDEYMKSIDKQVAVGTPLMAEEEDVVNLARVLNDEADIKDAISKGIVAFMGHGNPENYDYYGANIRYSELETELQKLNPSKYYVGTVDMPDNYIEDVVGRMEENGIAKGTNVQLYPLMSIAGDHAHNDMADEEDDESWVNVLNANGYNAAAYLTTFPASEACAKTYKAGDEYIPALGERTAVRKLWMNHTRAAINAIAAGEGLSTPTTSTEE